MMRKGIASENDTQFIHLTTILGSPNRLCAQQRFPEFPNFLLCCYTTRLSRLRTHKGNPTLQILHRGVGFASNWPDFHNDRITIINFHVKPL